ncbi:MAG: FAD:protein FMN transferase [Thermoguttaceae bacterium]|nr:FAD:protein FMN transferase [Thermoguttaceae bacterium]
MSQENPSKENAEPAAPASSVFALCRTILIVALVGYLGFTFLKTNPQFRAMLQKWSDAQTGAVGGVLSVGGETMGTYWNVKVSNPSRKWNESKLAETAREIFDRVDALMSTYRADSEISLFNRSDSLDWLPVSAETAGVVDLAQRVAAETGGAFDVTVAPLVNFWRFGPEKEPLAAFPSDGEIDAVRAKVGYTKLEVRLDPPALKKSIPELSIDLSAVAKGYAVDAAADRLAEELNKGALSGFMVDVGGEVRCGGVKGLADPASPEQRVQPWLMGIELPIDAAPSDAQAGAPPRLARVVRVQSGAIATSGGARNAFEIGGKRFSHIIDPATGKPSELADGAPRVGSVSVFLPTCARADAYATALCVLGPEKGIALMNRLEIPALYQMKNADGTFSDLSSDPFANIDSEPVAAE